MTRRTGPPAIGLQSPDEAPGVEPDGGAAVSVAPPTGGPLSRRRFLRVIGYGTLAILPLPVLPSVLQAAVGTTPVAGDGATQPARTVDGRIRQWAMVIDLRSCDGCQSTGKPPRCTAACIEGHFVPEPMEWIEVYEADLPGGGTQFMPTPCMHCQNPPCVNVCPVGATFSTPEGTVLIDQERCIGCRICMAACPYDRRFFNWGDAPVPPESMLADYSPEHQVPATRGTVMKCDFCPDMASAGVLPYCVQACPNGAIFYADLEEDLATNGEAIASVSRLLSENQAYRQKEELGTAPRVYYIPGHGEAVGRDAFTSGRLATEWPWAEPVEGAIRWQR
jgi:molybdopterin-containing oxidoreductase family iron-sulfur binding subunit